MRLCSIVEYDIFYLASKSPRRKWLLSFLPLKFEVISVNNKDIEISHTNTITEDPYSYAIKNSFLKAENTMNRISQGYLISCDTVVYADGQIHHKPKGRSEAYRSLKALSGSQHRVISGVTLYDTVSKICLSEFEETRVTFKNLSDDEILDYIETGEPFDKAGSYGLQGYAINFLIDIEGTKSNVYGLPLKTLIRMILKIKGLL